MFGKSSEQKPSAIQLYCQDLYKIYKGLQTSQEKYDKSSKTQIFHNVDDEANNIKYQIYYEIVKRQIINKLNHQPFGNELSKQKNILDLDFSQLIRQQNNISNQILTSKQKSKNIIMQICIQHDFCIEEVNSFINSIMNTIESSTKDKQNVINEQTLQKNLQQDKFSQKEKNQNAQKIYQYSQNKFNSPQQIEEQEYINKSFKRQNTVLQYNFMGVIHRYQINNLEMTVKEFLQDVIGEKSQYYEVILIKNMNLQQIQIRNPELFLMELYNQQQSHSIYIMLKYQQVSNLLSEDYIQNTYKNSQAKQQVFLVENFLESSSENNDRKEELLNKNQQEQNILKNSHNQSQNSKSKNKIVFNIDYEESDDEIEVLQKRNNESTDQLDVSKNNTEQLEQTEVIDISFNQSSDNKKSIDQQDISKNSISQTDTISDKVIIQSNNVEQAQQGNRF